MTFLQTIAHDLLSRYGTDLSRITVVLPNKRARLFLNEYLCQAADVPVWSPTYADLNDLFRGATTLQAADPLRLITELYRVYTDVSARRGGVQTETFDEFYFFGEMLLNDFNDIDKQLVNSMALFANLADLDTLKDGFEHLNEEQWEAINRFFRDISTNKTALKEAFYSIWSMLGEVYEEFRQRLAAENLAYDGMLFRAALENLQTNGTGDSFPQEKYVFAGFNVLTSCEKELLKILKKNDKGLFYWDYKKDFFPEEVDYFMPENIRLFGNEFVDNAVQKPKRITLAASPSESAQAGFVPQWINSLRLSSKGFDKPDSAIVLCNEQNLQAVMHAIPPTANRVNITMGFPLTQTPVYSLIVTLAELQLKGADRRTFRYNYVLPVLRNPYVRLIFPEAAAVQQAMTEQNNFFPTQDDLQQKQIFRFTESAAEMAVYLLEIVKTVAMAYGKKIKNEDENSFGDLYSEALFRAFQTLNRLCDLLQAGELQVEKTTFVSLLKRLLSSTSVPFHGEPVEGLQVMGVLETRNMDFRNLLVMSLNEGIMPKSDSESSFIPHFIRQFFGMTTIEHQDALYAYYFYRLLQRAENVVLMYNTANQQVGKAEISRFLLQLLAESDFEIEHINLQSAIKPHNAQPVSVAKTPELLLMLHQKYDLNTNPEAHRLSPSAMNSYLDCPLRFYLQYVEGVKSPEELTDELDNSFLGSVFHRAIELIYKSLGKIPSDVKTFPAFTVEAEHLELFLKAESGIENAVEQAFNEIYFKREMPRNRYNGEQLIYFRIVKQFIKQLLRLDKSCAPFEIVALECEEEKEMTVNDIRINIGGIIDRIDRKNGVLRVVDYKTGSASKDPEFLELVFEQGKDRPKHQFQAFVYASILTEKQHETVVPALIYLQKATDESYSPVCCLAKTPIDDFREISEDFDGLLKVSLQELFNPDVPFNQTTVEKNCEWCDFKGICGKA